MSSMQAGLGRLFLLAVIAVGTAPGCETSEGGGAASSTPGAADGGGDAQTAADGVATGDTTPGASDSAAPPDDASAGDTAVPVETVGGQDTGGSAGGGTHGTPALLASPPANCALLTLGTNAKASGTFEAVIEAKNVDTIGSWYLAVQETSDGPYIKGCADLDGDGATDTTMTAVFKLGLTAISSPQSPVLGTGAGEVNVTFGNNKTLYSNAKVGLSPLESGTMDLQVYDPAQHRVKFTVSGTVKVIGWKATMEADITGW